MARSSLSLRDYQHRIVQDVSMKNAIIKMPTGSGKTFVAAELIKRRLHYVASKKAVFLVPTIDLVDQQASAIEKWLGGVEIVARFHGGVKDPMITWHRVLVSTPAAFLKLLQSDVLSWDVFSICVFDEVHHVLKDHPYRLIAHGLKHFIKTVSGSLVQIVGLSASLTYAVDDGRIKRALEGLCTDLSITMMCSPSHEELVRDGYQPQSGNTEIIDIRDTPHGVLPVYQRLPHQVHETFIKRVQSREATNFALLVWDAIALMEKYAARADSTFQSPLPQSKLASWAEYANQWKKQNDPSSSTFRFFHLLEKWYVALKLIVVTWEEEEALTLQWLKSQNAFDPIADFGPDLQAKLDRIAQMASDASAFMKLNCLCGQLLEKKARFRDTFRCVIFVKQRIAAYVISHYINETDQLQAIEIRARYVAAKGSKLTPSIKVSHTESKEALSHFRKGEIDVLVATAVAEEGIDVPAANVVISYNEMKDSVELCQREGRARQKDCVFVVMEQRRDRPISVLRQVQQVQERVVQSFDPSIDSSEARERNMQSMMDREVAARHIFDKDVLDGNYMSVLNYYRQKTKSVLDENVVVAPDGRQHVTLSFSNLRIRMDATGVGLSKKEARQDAAKALLHKLANANRVHA